MRKQWGREKDNLLRNFDRIIKKNGNKKKGEKSKCECFYDSSKNQMFTEVTGIIIDNSAVVSDISTSVPTQSTSDNEIHNIPEPDMATTGATTTTTSSVPKKPAKSHNDQTLVVCISCLKRSNENRPKKVFESEFLTNQFSAYYPDFIKDKEYLPKIICKCCFDKLSSKSEPNVDYTGLAVNIKFSQCFHSNPTNICEVCRIASSSINSVKSPLVLNPKSNPGRPTILPKQKIQPKITDFYKFTKFKKDMSENDKINHLINTVSTKSLDQVSAAHIRNKAKRAKAEGSDEIFLQSVHGPPLKFPLKERKEKAVIGHSTLMKIKCEIQASGNRIVKVAQIISDDCGEDIKIEEYFKETVIKSNQEVNTFFDHKIVDMFIYDEKDFQMFKLSDEEYLVVKVGHLQFKQKVITLPPKTDPGYIVDDATGHVLTVENDEIIFRPKIKSKKHKTRSGRNRANPKNSLNYSDISDKQAWIIGPADSYGWHRIIHASSKKLLTSSSSDKLTVENLKENKGKTKKQLTKCKKVFVYCPHLEAFISYIVCERDYKDDSDIKVDIGLDGGGGSLKLFMSVEEKNPEIGVGSFGKIKRRRKAGGYMSKYLDSGVMRTHVIAIAMEVPETHANLRIFLDLSNVVRLSCTFAMDFKCMREALGMQSCASKFSCAYCHGSAPFLVPATMRTFKNLKENHAVYLALIELHGPVAGHALAMNAFNVTNESLIVGDYIEQWILWKCPPDELHLFLGIGNHILTKLHKCLMEDIDNGFVHKGVHVWLQDNNIVGLKYRGGQVGWTCLEQFMIF